MEENLNQETERLIRSWMQHDASHLRDYLVAGVEDPRINLQSIFSRHFLLQARFGERFSQLMEQEYRFSAVMNWLQEFASRASTVEEFEIVLHALRMRSDNAEGVIIPGFVVITFAELSTDCHFEAGRDAFLRVPIRKQSKKLDAVERVPTGGRELSIPNYIELFLNEARPENGPSKLDRQSLNTFEELWRREIETALPTPHVPNILRVVEPACGSANDFRFLHRYGLTKFIDYTGFDLCSKNIENARTMFPGIRFEIGNVLEIDASAQAFDFCFVHDLFEHLSIEAMQVAAKEVCRVTARGLGIGFFNMNETRDHFVRPVDEYHWNTLSLAKMQSLFSSLGFVGKAIHIETFLRSQVGCEHTHNPSAYTVFLCRA